MLRGRFLADTVLKLCTREISLSRHQKVTAVFARWQRPNALRLKLSRDVRIFRVALSRNL